MSQLYQVSVLPAAGRGKPSIIVFQEEMQSNIYEEPRTVFKFAQLCSRVLVLRDADCTQRVLHCVFSKHIKDSKERYLL